MVGFTTAVNSILYLSSLQPMYLADMRSQHFANLLFYIIITPILTTTLMKLAYAGEAQMQVVDGLKRIRLRENRQSLKETTNGQIPKDSNVHTEKKMQSIIFPLRSKRENTPLC